MEKNREALMYARIVSKITEVEQRIESAKASVEVDWYREDLEDYQNILAAFENGTITELLAESNNYGEVWEKWMALKGLAEEI